GNRGHTGHARRRGAGHDPAGAGRVRPPVAMGAGRTHSYPVLHFEEAGGWSEWLDANHATAAGAWLRLARKGAGLNSVTRDEALDAALCYGWIDGQAKSHDDESWLQKYTPRGSRSLWSKRNR